jgi:hypothetical protein
MCDGFFKAGRGMFAFTYRPNDRHSNVVLVVVKDAVAAHATHLPAATIRHRSEADLQTWLRHAVSGTSLVLHLTGHERLESARRLAWFVETCRCFGIDLVVETDRITPDALELLHALGAEVVRFDETLDRHWRGRAVVRRIRVLAEALDMAA